MDSMEVVKTNGSKWFDKSKPLWLPDGTVRALLVLGLTWAVVVIMLKFAVYREEIPQSVEKIMMALLPAIVLLIERYITTRSEEKKP